MYRELDPKRIEETAERLRHRIEERFPGSGLGQVASELVELARRAGRDSKERRPVEAVLRGGSLLLASCIVGLLLTLAIQPRLGPVFRDFTTFVTTLEATLGSVVFIGVAILFLLTVEVRLKRRRILAALDEIRAMAHIVDMHQLTKSPEVLLGPRTASSPERRSMTPFELSRYLDYCGEMLALLGKIGAVWAYESHDPVALASADQIEDLTTGLSRKVWQKIMILGGVDRGLREECGD
jgi:hypothetical protein